MRLFVSLFFVFYTLIGFSQQETKPVVDSLFREDQFYVSISYNLLQKKNIVMGSKDIDITVDILSILNDKIKEVNLK